MAQKRITQLVRKVQPEDRTPFTYTGAVPIYVEEWESEDGVQGHMLIIGALAPGTTNFQEAPIGSFFFDTNALEFHVKTATAVWEQVTTQAVDNILRSVTVGLTAGTTQTQAGALALTTDLNQVSVCANANDGVKLPSAEAGMIIHVINNGAAVLQVWPATSDQIDNGAADAVDAAILAPGQIRTYAAYNATNWETNGQHNLSSTLTTITAGTTQTQVGATQLAADINQVSVCANAGDGVKLPLAQAGMVVRIINNGAAAAQVWPATGDVIDAESANAVDPNTVAPGEVRTYVSWNATNWETSITATSGGFSLQTVTAGISAGSTQTQAGATALTSEINQVSTTGTANDGVKLPSAVAGMVIRIVNNGAENLKIWPASGDQIDAESVNAGDSNVLATAGTRTYTAYNATNWETQA